MASKFVGMDEATRKEYWSIPPDEVIVAENHARAPFGMREDLIEQLMASIPVKGQLQPGVCRKRSDGRLEVIEGRNRREAIRRLRENGHPNLEFLYVIEHNINDERAFEESVIANVQRSDSNPMDFAYQIDRFVSVYHRDYDDLLKEVFSGGRWTRQKLQLYHSLLKLPRDIQEMVFRGEVGFSHALFMARMSSEAAMRNALRRIPGEDVAVPDDALPETAVQSESTPELILGEEPPKPKKRGPKPKGNKPPKKPRKNKAVDRDSLRKAAHKDGKRLARSASEFKAFLKGRGDKLSNALLDYFKDKDGMDDDRLDVLWNEIVHGVVPEDAMEEVEA